LNDLKFCILCFTLYITCQIIIQGRKKRMLHVGSIVARLWVMDPLKGKLGPMYSQKKGITLSHNYDTLHLCFTVLNSLV